MPAAAQHIGNVVPGIGHQRCRIGNEAIGELNHDKSGIQDDGNDEGAAVIV